MIENDNSFLMKHTKYHESQRIKNYRQCIFMYFVGQFSVIMSILASLVLFNVTLNN